MNDAYAKFLMQKTREDYDKIAEEFSATRKTMWPELGDLDKYVKEGDTVLDIGCGNGKLFGYLSEKVKNFSYCGLDVSEKLIAIARSNFLKAEFKTFDGINISCLDQNFDVVFCLATLPHLPGEKMRLEFLKNIRMVVKPGGLIVVTCWNLWQPKFLKYQLKSIANFITDKIFGKNEHDWGDFYIPWKKRGVEPINRFYHAFTISELNSILKKAGWEAEEIGCKERGEKKRFNLYAVARKSMATNLNL
jgi:2-polyprenyl-3-methyl-5-hydroxy-6-metoxy-1,4-benzoquinol methylase